MEKNNQSLVLHIKRIFISPIFVTMVVMLVVAGWVIIDAEGDVLALARLGTKFSEGITGGSEGYDGQFVYYMARDLNTASVKVFLDVPAYRYQRILLPLLVRMISLGNIRIIPWAILLVNIIFHAGGTWGVGKLISGWGINRWYALVYGGWVGFGLAIRLDLPEPLAFGLVVFALLTYTNQKSVVTWVLSGLALFAKEVTVVFILAFLIIEILGKQWRKVMGMICVTFVPYAIFQIWLWSQFGEFGISSGGAMATPFEIIPYMGLLRIGNYSLVYMAMMMIVFGPSIVLPSLWGVIVTLKKWIGNEFNIFCLALFLNCLAIMFMPFSTFRETGGLLRYSDGLVLSLILFAAYYRMKKVLNYSVFWLIFNVFLFK